MTLSSLKILYTKLRNIVFQKTTSALDYCAYHLGISAVVHTPDPATSLTVYYIGENLPPRISRMVKWLKRTQPINALLICHIDGYNAFFSNDSFDRVLLYRNTWHLRRLLRDLPAPSLIHGFGPKSYYPDMARQYLSTVKFIYDMQDVLAIYFGLNVNIKWYQKEFVHEYNCLALSAGLVSHGLEPIPANRVYKIATKNKRLFFPLFCDDDMFCDNTKQLDLQNISLVYAGEIQGANRDKKQFGNVQFFDLIEILSAQRIHFHVYGTPHSYKLFGEEYRQVERVNPYFHLHAPVAQSHLPNELSKYHFGIIPFFKTNTALLDDKNYYSTSLKLFNYIEAGIPVLVSDEIVFQKWIACRYGAGIAICKEDLLHLRTMIEQIDYSKFTAHLVEQRGKLSLKNNIHRLSHFYQDIINSNGA